MTADTVRRYDRELLLGGSKRNTVLDLWEVQPYGNDSYDDPDDVSIYGMPPDAWYAKGVRIVGRTAVECTRDGLGDAIGKDVALVARHAPGAAHTVIVDPFAGSGNTLYWLSRHLPGGRSIGFESDASVCRLTRHNVSAPALPIEIVDADYQSGLAGLSVARDGLLVVFIAPPWGDALDASAGLDLRRTTPPVAAIADLLFGTFSESDLLCAIQIHETVRSASLAELRARFDWSTQRIYGLNAPGQNHGLLLGTKRWSPEGH